MPFISRTFIADRLLPAVSIEKLIGKYVPDLKRAGSSYVCCCPFHKEKTPSFHVTPSKGLFHCFGCKESGNAIDFIRKYKNLDFVSAVEELAQYAGMEVEYEHKPEHDRADLNKPYYELLDRCASAFQQALFAKENENALNYYMQKRGMSREMIIAARLGFAPNSWSFLQEKVARNQEDINRLVDLGMLVRKEDRVFPMYHNRVMIPIIDRRHRVVSFGGRTMGDDKPKYLNTKESPIYRKRNELFGFCEALDANRNKPERIVIVEGYMDVLSVRQAGCTYAVASLGTATTPEQFKMMFGVTDKVVCCYDGDAAGRHAAWHALSIATPQLSADKEVRFAFLPPEHDPDSYVREFGKEAFEKFLDNSFSYPEFLIRHCAEEYNLSDPGQLSPFLSNALSKIKAIPIRTLQAAAVKLLAKPSGIPETQLFSMLDEALPDSDFMPRPEFVGGRQNSRQESAPANYRSSNKPYRKQNPRSFEIEDTDTPKEKSLLNTPMRKLIAFILQQPTVVATFLEDFSLFSFVDICTRLKIRGSADLSELISSIAREPDITPARFLEYSRDTQKEGYIRKLITAELGLSTDKDGELPLNKRADFLSKCLSEVLIEAINSRAFIINNRISAATPEEKEELKRIRETLLELKQS